MTRTIGISLLPLTLICIGWGGLAFADPSGEALSPNQIEVLGLGGSVVQWPQNLLIKEVTLTPDPMAPSKFSGHLKGRYSEDSQTGREFSLNGIRIERSAGGDFEVAVPLAGAVTPVPFKFIDHFGKVLPLDVEIHANFPKPEPKARVTSASQWTFQAGMGTTILSYAETGVPNYSGTLLTLKGSGTYLIRAGIWDAGLTGFATVMPISESPTGAGVRFLGMNFRVGRSWLINQRIRLGLHSGGYWTTMLVSSKAFGFQNQMGPQIFPTLRYLLANRNAIRGYLKFAAIGSGAGLESPSNNEIAIGASYDFRAYGRWASVSLDLARLAVKIEDVQITSNSASLGASVSF